MNTGRFTVRVDGREIDVWNRVNITEKLKSHTVGLTTHVRHDIDIGAGASPHKPDAITLTQATDIEAEYGIDPRDNGIEVIDLDDPNVEIL